MGDNSDDRKEDLNNRFLSTEEKVDQLEKYIEQMKDDIKQLKKISKHKEKIEKLEHEKKKIISKNLKNHRKRH